MPSNHFFITAHGSGQIITGPGTLLGIDVGTSGGTNENCNIYDGVGAVNLLFTFDATTGRSFDMHHYRFNNGLYYELTGTGTSAKLVIWFIPGGPIY
jgi:hypothetical protein